MVTLFDTHITCLKNYMDMKNYFQFHNWNVEPADDDSRKWYVNQRYGKRSGIVKINEDGITISVTYED